MLIDSTLREGEQLFGAYYTPRDKAAILAGLGELGVEEIELGNTRQDDLSWLVAEARRRAPGARLSVWCPCREEDLCKAAASGVDRVNVGVPAGEAHREKRLGVSREVLRRRLSALVREAHCLGVSYLSVGLEDAPGADPAFALELAGEAQALGAARIRLSDTVGRLDPAGMSELLARFRPALACHLAVHCHNDFGLATANAWTALRAGADFADASVLGSGERSGIAPLEELAALLALRAPAGRRRPYDLRVLPGLAGTVSRAARLAVPRTKPVVGQDIFAAESGLHVAGLSKDPALFEPFPPEAVAGTRCLGLGKKSGRTAVRLALARLGLALPEAALPGLVASVRSQAACLGRPITDAELEVLSREHATAPQGPVPSRPQPVGPRPRTAPAEHGRA